MTRPFRGALACALLLLAAPALAQSESTKLLANASASGGVTTPMPGGGYQFSVSGTFGGATVALYVSGPDGTLAVAPACSFTAASACTVNIGQGSTVQARVSGGTPSGLYAWLQGLGGPISSGGGGGGGGGDASAANQTSQITLETAIRDQIGGAISSPATYTTNYWLKTINATLGTPLQAGGSVSLAGTLPAFASPPAVTDANNAAFQGAVALTVGTTYSGSNIGRSIAMVCTVIGNVSLTFPDTSTLVVPISATGLTILPFAVASVNTSGTTATCTYANLK